jgi:tRNA-Thr(GGU) m(6)t(6)A37 methyltransferase TsaA
VAAGDELIVLTWLHEANRSTLQVHPRSDGSNPLTGVFLTRSPDRPNPIGIHRVTVRAIEGTRLRIGPIEAIDGTPVIDIKSG